MARGIERLSALFVGKVKEPGMYADGAGLYLQVTKAAPDDRGRPKVTKSWIFRYTLRGRAREMGLGPIHDVSLAEARETARQYRKLRKEGIDPIEHRKKERQARALETARSITFKRAAEDYIELHKAEWGTDSKSPQQWANSLANYVYPVFGDWSVQLIDTPAVLKVLEKDNFWTTKTVTAERVRGRIETILDWCATRGYRAKGDNPATWVGHLEHSLPQPAKVHSIAHHPALPYTEIGDFMVRLRERKAVSARALEFLILTATRSNETLGAKWVEIKEVERYWEIPAERMKGRKNKRRAHKVPLSDEALAVLLEMKKISRGEFVFPNGTRRFPLGSIAMDDLLRRMDIPRERATVHGFRSTFRDWASERTNFPREVCEMALAHAIGDKTEEAYRRGDLYEKRRRLMDAWARHCAALAEATGEVRELRAAG